MRSPEDQRDQQSLVLQMLKTERIALEDAQVLFELLEAGENRRNGNGTGNDRKRLPKTGARRRAGDLTRPSRERALGGVGSVGESMPRRFDLSALAARLKESLSSIESAVKETLQAMDAQSALQRAASVAQTSVEGRLSVELTGSERLLSIENPWGDVVVRGVRERRETRVTYRVSALADQKRTADYHAEFTRISVEPAGSKLAVKTIPPGDASQRRIKVDLAIELPEFFGAHITSDCGDFTAADLHGGVTFSGGISEVVLQRLRGAVNTRTRLGNIVAALTMDRRAEIHARCGGGSIEIEVPADDRVHTETELRTIAFPKADSEGNRFELHTDSGNVRIESA